MNSGPTLTANIQTWAQDSLELLDYDAKVTTNITLKTKENCYLTRANSLLSFSDQLTESLDDIKILAQLQAFDSYFSVSPVTTLNSRALERSKYEKLWLVVKFIKKKGEKSGYLLAEGDVIRIGRCKFRVKDLSSAKTEGLESFSLCDMLSINNDSDEEASDSCRSFALPCRICLSEVYEPENPLISPCKCGGTMKYIHLKCLQQFLMSKLTAKSSDNVLSFTWKKLSCDLCKKTYPYRLNLKGRTVELLEIPKPPGQYIILEALCKDLNSLKGLHVVHINERREIKIGRSQESELRLTDISVSRNHAKLAFSKDGFFIEDTGSKFGTLIQIKRPIPIEEGKEITVQSGRSLVTYSVRLPWTLIPACFRSRTGAFENGLNGRGLPLLPLNTGIPISICDPYKLLAFAGAPIKKFDKEKHKNLLHEHNQLGYNSSFEGEADGSIESIEDVEIANAEENSDDVQCEETNRFYLTDLNT